MELKAGYKQTEVGVIPEDWDCRPLQNLIAPESSITYGIVQAGPHIEGGIPYIKTGDMSGDRLQTEGLARTSPTIASRYPRSKVSAGELVYSIRASVGSVHRVPFELDGANLTQGTARIAPNKNIDAEFLLRALRSRPCQNWVNFRTKGTTYKEITLATLRQVPVPLPPTKAEQQAIAAALGDVDALIAALDRLIAKKRDIKQGMMQELLTGNRRLPGFECGKGYKQTEVGLIPEDWQCTTVGQLVRDGILEKPLDGNHGNIHPKREDFVSSGIPFVMANNIRSGHVDLINCAFIRREQADSLQKGFSRSGDVLLTHKATIGNTAVVGEVPFEYIMLTPQVTYYRVADKSRLNNFYLRHFFDSSSFQNALISMSGGGTRAYIGITRQLMLPVVLPPTITEQEAIACVLSDMDSEIAALEAHREKTRALKEGMMQELLTGRIRLVQGAEA